METIKYEYATKRNGFKGILYPILLFIFISAGLIIAHSSQDISVRYRLFDMFIHQLSIETIYICIGIFGLLCLYLVIVNIKFDNALKERKEKAYIVLTDTYISVPFGKKLEIYNVPYNTIKSLKVFSNAAFSALEINRYNDKRIAIVSAAFLDSTAFENTVKILSERAHIEVQRKTFGRMK